MTPMQQCPVCGYEEAEVSSDNRDGHGYSCPRCGPFWVSGSAIPLLGNADSSVRPNLSAWIRQRYEHGRDRPEINSASLTAILESLPHYTVAQKQQMLLHAVETRVSTPAETARLHVRADPPVAWAADENELRYLARALEDRQLVRLHVEDAYSLGFEIAPAGWSYLDERVSSLVTNQVFVAMSFDKRMDDAWSDGIEPALESTGYRPLRVDKEPHIERIDVKILADIKDSCFVVADVTGHRPGVYFEAGYAMGLALPVVWSVHEDDLEKLSRDGFDTRQFNHIVWADARDLRAQLENTVVAVIGRAS